MVLTRKTEDVVKDYTRVITYKEDGEWKTHVDHFWATAAPPWIMDILHQALPPEGIDLRVSKVVFEHRDGGSEVWVLSHDDSA